MKHGEITGQARSTRLAGPAHPARVLAVHDIPRTHNGKISEIAVRDVVHGRAVKNTEALANPEALDECRDRPELGDGNLLDLVLHGAAKHVALFPGDPSGPEAVLGLAAGLAGALEGAEAQELDGG